MKSTLVLALAGSAVAAPTFSDFFDAVFGPGNTHSGRPRPTGFPGFSGLPSGAPFPFPTGGPGAPGASGAPFPFPTGVSGIPEGPGSTGAPSLPFPGSNDQAKRDLHIDYELAPKAREVKHRQLDNSPLPSFSLLDPNQTPTAAPGIPGLPTDLPSGLPTPPAGGPTDFPSFPTPPAGGSAPPFPFPTGGPSPPAGTGVPDFPSQPPAGTGFPGFPGIPTTLLTRGPQPTAAPDVPGQESDDEEDDETENGNGWLGWVSELLSGGKGQD